MELDILKIAIERGGVHFRASDVATTIRHLALSGDSAAGFETLVRNGWAVRHGEDLYEVTPAGAAKAASFGWKKRRQPL